ncbi:unnamed protein product [Bemisia tabaci]|uniref:Cadherin domain-containing protein n=1 Tax=Bemisia tabaci TaxID=7038 RepID=A0A9P0EZZ6_BEMTA|nr:unnamed protein product [Bemisia tabaci]
MRVPHILNILGLFIGNIFEILAAKNGKINRPPQFVPGGDMARFSLPEDTHAGTAVYKLLASDPESTTLHFSISGEYFSVDRNTGVVTLLKPLDREEVDSLEVIISVTDEPIGGAEANTVSLRKEIPVIDVNDNKPVFLNRPYVFSVSEVTKVGTTLFSNITITDKDQGLNAEVVLSCVQSDACQYFSLSTEKVGEGEFMGIVTLAQPLDFEKQSAHSLMIRATDSNPKKRLSSTANIAINVLDVQDQPPVFVNAPYSSTLKENTPEAQDVLTVKVQDGDASNPRPITLSIENDNLHYFTLVEAESGVFVIQTSEIPIDREHPSILENGGVYTFNLRATELINGLLPSDTSVEPVTIVVTDIDDQKPVFNQQNFYINVSESISIGTPLPGLSMTVSDNDVGENARYILALDNLDHRINQWFKVEPEAATGHTPVVIRVINNKGLDYDRGVKKLQISVVAYVESDWGVFDVGATAEVFLNILDANDNAPQFSEENYSFTIPEDTPLQTMVANLTATDADSGDFAKISYVLRGFGMDKFYSDHQMGGLYVANKLDYEKQKSYSLSLEAKDGGGLVTAVNILVHLSDVNDNAPEFEANEYRRSVREGASSFQPQFFVKAMDRDTEANGKVSYSIIQSNSEVISVKEETGEIFLIQPASSSHTSRGQYELVIRATDHGTRPLHTDVPVFVHVGVSGNQRPVFKGAPYNVTIRENAQPLSPVIAVQATDPDGPDNQIEYRIANSADNFHINSTTGLISVSKKAILDLDVSKTSQYAVQVMAIDNGSPLRETAQTTVLVNIFDVNNKPPEFLSNANQNVYISEKTPIGEAILKMEAVDPDSNHNLGYYIVEPIKVFDKTGLTPKETRGFDLKNAFRINESSGELQVNSTLDHQAAAVIILTIEVRDKNAEEKIEEQFARVEVSVYIQPHNEENPVFLVGGWTSSDPIIKVTTPEEQAVGTTILQIIATDPLTDEPIRSFRALTALPRQLALDQAGNLLLTERLDYEVIGNTTLSLRLQAISEDDERYTDALVLIKVDDVNDHQPEFVHKRFTGSVVESANKGTFILKVQATDGDLPDSPYGYGTISYSLSGEHSSLVSINNETGEIKVAGDTIDREKMQVLRLIVTAVDTPLNREKQRRVSAPVIIEVVDINDNAPTFSSSQYSFVVLENVPLDTSVLNVSATDPDSGDGGRVEYELVDTSEAAGLFSINSQTGELKTAQQLTGKGRAESYGITIRAQDAGTPSLFTDVIVKVYIGDVISNDGVPSIIHPALGEVAYISENASIGTPVFKVVASDPDDPNSPEGRLMYSFLQDGSDSLNFFIDADTGRITTRALLDRETKEKYSLLLVVQDSGSVPQQTTQVLNIIVTDVDDHKPVFKRAIDESPVRLEILEESMPNSIIGTVKAVDLDVGDNANIGYLITYGNENDLFAINRTENNTGLITAVGRLDRESVAEHLLTIKCFKLSDTPSSLRKAYSRQDFSEIQVRIIVLEIDDNLPQFQKGNITVGARVNVPIDTLLLTLQAVDIDYNPDPITYSVKNWTFVSGFNSLVEVPNTPLPFHLNSQNGELRTSASMIDYMNGHFILNVSARNSDDEGKESFTTVKIYVERDRVLLKFIFLRPPTEIKTNLPNFTEEVEKALALKSSQLNIYDTQFYEKEDGSLDFSSTSSCFQLLNQDNLDLNEVHAILRDTSNNELKRVYDKYQVASVQRCAPQLLRAEVKWSQIAVLGIACFIGIAALISIFVLCCAYNRWKKMR